MVRVGATVLALDEPVGAALAEFEAAEDEPLRDEDVPPLPAEPAPAFAQAPAPPASLPTGDALPRTPERPTPTPRLPPAAGRTRGWSGTDVAVAMLAVLVIGASLATLVGVLR